MAGVHKRGVLETSNMTIRRPKPRLSVHELYYRTTRQKHAAQKWALRLTRRYSAKIIDDCVNMACFAVVQKSRNIQQISKICARRRATRGALTAGAERVAVPTRRARNEGRRPIMGGESGEYRLQRRKRAALGERPW
jgi:hypothetical protein